MKFNFEKIFNKKDTEASSEKTTKSLYPGLSASSKRLLGLKEFAKLSTEEIKEIFPSEERLNTYLNVKTDTYPQGHKIEYKKGIIREIVSKNLISEEILKNHPTLYLGSGIDIEYPLSLGARDIWLIDPMLQNTEARQELEQKIKRLTKNGISLEKQNNFNFDFNNGKENVKINLIAKTYGSDKFDLPQNIGLVVKFASQGPSGEIIIGTDIESNMANGGYILDESCLSKIENGVKKAEQLGK